MQDQISPTPAEEEKRVDAAILGWLLSDQVRAPVSVDEVGREIDEGLAVTDSLDRLYGAGLVHRLDEFVFATQAARHVAELSL